FWYCAAFEQDRQGGSEVFAPLVFQAVDGLGQRAAVQVRRGCQNERRRLLATVRATPWPQCRQERFVPGHAAHRTARREWNQRVGADAAERGLSGRVARGATHGKDQVERADRGALQL